MREVYLFHSLLCYIGWINFGLALWIIFELAKTYLENCKKHYAKRKIIVEPLFGWMKENRNFKKFQRRGLGICKSEWKLICLTQNILKFSGDMRARTLSLVIMAIEPVIDLLEGFHQFLIFQSLPRRILI